MYRISPVSLTRTDGGTNRSNKICRESSAIDAFNSICCLGIFLELPSSGGKRALGKSTRPARAAGDSLRWKIFHLLSMELKRSWNPPMVSDEPRNKMPPGFNV